MTPVPRALETAAWTVLALTAFAFNSILTRMALGRGLIDAAGFAAVRLATGAAVLALLVFLAARSWRPLRWRGARGPLALFAYAAPFSFAYLRMLSAVLGRVRLEPEAAGGRGLVHTAVFQSDMDGVRWEEVESVVDVVRTAAEAEVAAVFKEVGPDAWSASLRAQSTVDVRHVAVAMGGGGHRRAAGFTATGSLDGILDRLRAELG